MGTFFKAAGIIIQDRKLLAERSTGKPFFITPGGKLEPGETDKQALIRELQEELLITVREADLEHFGTFSAEAANHPGNQVHIEAFVVRKWQGAISRGQNVEELLWLDSKAPQDLPIASIIQHELLPRLQARGLVD